MATVYLGLGANVGDREANLRSALGALNRMGRVERVSSLYETAPVGPEQPPFYNAACRFETGLRPGALLRFLQGVEHEIGRRPGEERWGPRSIDLDILLYGSEAVDEDGLTVPHPRMYDRAFVLVPLAEIAPDLQYPGSGETIAQLASAVDASGVRRIAEAGWDGVVTAGEAPFRA